MALPLAVAAVAKVVTANAGVAAFGAAAAVPVAGLAAVGVAAIVGVFAAGSWIVDQFE